MNRARARIYFSDDPVEVRWPASINITRLGPAAVAALPEPAPHGVGEPDVEMLALRAGGEDDGICLFGHARSDMPERT